MGAAIVFVCLLAALGLFSVFILAYAANCFLVVVEQTAAGIDEVAWPDEPLVDWLGKAVHLLWMVAFWLVPTGFLLRFAKNAFLPHEPILRFLIPSAVLLWLLFPMSLLSSLSAQSRLVFFRPAIVVGFLRCFPAVVGFYAMSLVLLGITAAALGAGLRGSMGVMTVVAPAVTATTLLIYARLLGRVAWLLMQLEPDEDKPARMESPPPKVKGVKATDPWAAPKPKRKRRKRAKSEPPPSLPVAGYSLSAEEPPPLPKKPPLDGYRPVGRDARFAQADFPKEELPPGDDPRPLSRLEERLAQSRDEPVPPAYPLLTGVFTFPWYSSMLKHWVVLGGLGCFLLFLWQMMVAFWPNG